MSRFEHFMSVENIYAALDDCASVRDSMTARAALLLRVAAKNHVTTKHALKMVSEARRDTNKWEDMDFYCDELESSFAMNWHTSGFPVFVLTDSMAALLSLTRSPPLDFDHVPHPAFLVEVPKRYIPLDSLRPTVTLAIESFAAMKVRDGAGNIGVIPDSNTVSRWAQSGNGNRINEDISKKPWMTIAIRIASNVIAYINEHRPGTESTPRISPSTPIFEVRPPRDVVIDRAFRDAASALVRAGNINAARGVLAHYVRGHWRNQAVGVGHSERRLTWVRPHKRGDEALGRVVQRIERLK